MLGSCPRIETVAGERHLSQIFRSFEAKCVLFNVVIGKVDQKGFFAVDFLFLDSLLDRLAVVLYKDGHEKDFCPPYFAHIISGDEFKTGHRIGVEEL